MLVCSTVRVVKGIYWRSILYLTKVYISLFGHLLLLVFYQTRIFVVLYFLPITECWRFFKRSQTNNSVSHGRTRLASTASKLETINPIWIKLVYYHILLRFIEVSLL